MKKCPQCGNRYRPDVDVCPNDGTKLTAGPPEKSPPPPATSGPPPAAGNGPPQKRSAAKGKKPKRPVPSAGYEPPGSLTEESSVGSWIFAIVACLLMFGGFYWARGQLLGTADDQPPASTEKQVDDDSQRSKKRRRGKRRRRRTERTKSYDDYDWTQDFEVDDRTFGDVIAEGEREPEWEYVEVEEPEPYDPSPDEYQPDGSYRPTARYAERGAGDEVVEIDLGGGGSGPLKPAQVEAVLDERKLAPCYDPWVSKIPQMKGRVWMDFVVAPDGHVSKVEVTRSQLRSKVVEKCLVQRARKFRFPASDGRSTKFDTHFDFTNR